VEVNNSFRTNDKKSSCLCNVQLDGMDNLLENYRKANLKSEALLDLDYKQLHLKEHSGKTIKQPTEPVTR